MKKTLLSAVAGLAVIGSACAAGSDTCNPEKYVWVEKDELCIPKNPCKSKSDVIRKAYCNQIFKDVQLSNWRDGVTVVEAYLNKRYGVSISSGSRIGENKDTSFFGQDYIPAKTTDGGYVVFEFDDLSDIGGADVREGVAKAVCLIYGGEFGTSIFDSYADRTGLFCSNLSSEQDCTDAAKIGSDILSTGLITSQYQETSPESIVRKTLCTFYIDR